MKSFHIGTVLTAVSIFVAAPVSFAGVRLQYGPSHAPLTQTAPQIVLIVRPLRNGGGLTVKTPDGKPLNVGFTTALRHYLQNKGHRRVLLMNRANDAPAHLPCYILEGELRRDRLSKTEFGAYYCTLRLVNDDHPDTPLGTWTGTAATLRDLNSNLTNNPQHHALGLQGELGDKVWATLARESNLEETMKSP